MIRCRCIPETVEV